MNMFSNSSLKNEAVLKMDHKRMQPASLIKFLESFWAKLIYVDESQNQPDWTDFS